MDPPIPPLETDKMAALHRGADLRALGIEEVFKLDDNTVRGDGTGVRLCDREQILLSSK